MRGYFAFGLAPLHLFHYIGPIGEYKLHSRSQGFYHQDRRQKLRPDMQELTSMTPAAMRRLSRIFALPGLLLAAAISTGTATAQNLFEPVIKVNDQAITRYEIEQRARMLTVFRAPGNPAKLAREQLIEDRLKLDAADGAGLVLEEPDIEAGMEEFAARADLSAEELIRALEGAGVAEQTFRAFVSPGVTCSELILERSLAAVSVSESDR